jgi:hypothetical protein
VLHLHAGVKNVLARRQFYVDADLQAPQSRRQGRIRDHDLLRIQLFFDPHSVARAAGEEISHQGQVRLGLIGPAALGCLGFPATQDPPDRVP